MMTISSILSILLYVLATGLLLKQWISMEKEQSKLPLYIALAAAIFHGIALYGIIFTAQGIDIGFFSALTFTAWLMATLLVIASFSLPIGCLGLLVYPFSLVTLIFRISSDQQHLLTNLLAENLQAHILFSLLRTELH